KKDIDIKKKSARILDDLKFAFFQKEKKDPTIPALRNFDFVPKEKQGESFSTLLESCGEAFDAHNADDFSARFDALNAFFTTNDNKKTSFTDMDVLLFAALLKRCREDKEITATLRHQLYWYMVGVLYLQTLKLRPEAYKKGFSDEEKQFLF